MQRVCHQYWPASIDSNETYCKFLITLVKEETHDDDYIIRKMEITESPLMVNKVPSMVYKDCFLHGW